MQSLQQYINESHKFLVKQHVSGINVHKTNVSDNLLKEICNTMCDDTNNIYQYKDNILICKGGYTPKRIIKWVHKNTGKDIFMQLLYLLDDIHKKGSKIYEAILYAFETDKDDILKTNMTGVVLYSIDKTNKPLAIVRIGCKNNLSDKYCNAQIGDIIIYKDKINYVSFESEKFIKDYDSIVDDIINYK